MARFHFDQNVALDIVVMVRHAGHDVVTTGEAGLPDADDDVHLLAAARASRILVTHNRRDFRLLHRAWQRWTRDRGVPLGHAGILVIPQPPFWSFRQAAVELQVIGQQVDVGMTLTNELREFILGPPPEWRRDSVP